MPFITLREPLAEIIELAIKTSKGHALFLNTLSYLENQGARKIAAAEDAFLVREEMLKHAAEEFRHAYYLKKQIAKIAACIPIDYSRNNILGWPITSHYLQALDGSVSRYLKREFRGDAKLFKKASYYLVTAAIELRASELYPLYQNMLKNARCPVNVQSILLEEEGHLNDMNRALESIPDGKDHLKAVSELESGLCARWMLKLEQDITSICS